MDILLKLLDWVDKHGGCCTMKDFSTALGQFSEDLGAIARVELADFRLNLFVQLMVLSGCTTGGCKILDKAFPAKDRGSYKTLTEVGRVKNPDDFEPVMQELSEALGLPRYRGQQMEGMCCENRPKRDNVNDYLFRNMTLFMSWVMSDGVTVVPVMKLYGETMEWLPVREQDSKWLTECQAISRS